MKVSTHPLRMDLVNFAIQKFLYQQLNEFSDSHPLLGRVLALPLAIEDGLAPILVSAIFTVNCAVLVPIHLLGAAFSSKHTIKLSIKHAQGCLSSLTDIPIQVVMSPIKAIYQIFALMINPTETSPFSSRR